MFLVSLECVNCVFYSLRQRPKFKSRKNQVQSKKIKFPSVRLLSRHLARSIKISTASSTPSSTDWDCNINKNLKHKNVHNLFVSNLICDPIFVLFKGHHKLSLESLSKREITICATRVCITKFLSISPY